jgi:hypothetical protein
MSCDISFPTAAGSPMSCDISFPTAAGSPMSCDISFPLFGQGKTLSAAIRAGAASSEQR